MMEDKKRCIEALQAEIEDRAEKSGQLPFILKYEESLVIQGLIKAMDIIENTSN